MTLQRPVSSAFSAALRLLTQVPTEPGVVPAAPTSMLPNGIVADTLSAVQFVEPVTADTAASAPLLAAPAAASAPRSTAPAAASAPLLTAPPTPSWATASALPSDKAKLIEATFRMLFIGFLRTLFARNAHRRLGCARRRWPIRPMFRMRPRGRAMRVGLKD